MNPLGGGRASTTDPATWGTFEQAWAAHQRQKTNGLGFVFTDNDPFVGIDLDHVRDPRTGEIEPWARAIIHRATSYTELSPSGTGVHIVVRGKLPLGSRRRGRLEMYAEGRFFTVTGQHLAGTPGGVEQRDVELAALHWELLGDPALNGHQPPREKAPSLELLPTIDDATLIGKACNAGNGARFAALWNGNTSDHGGDESAADMALACHLAFWTGRDPERVDRLFRQSGLFRDKWDSRRGPETYGAMTIRKAIAQTSETYNAPFRSSNVGTEADADEPDPSGAVIPAVRAGEAFPQADRGFLFDCLREDEYGDAKLLARLYDGRLVYDHGTKTWHAWAGHYWRQDRVDLVKRLVPSQVAAQYLHLAAELTAEAESETDVDRKNLKLSHADALMARAQNLRKLKRVINVLGFASSLLGITGDEWDRANDRLPCLNGVVDLRNGSIRPGQPTDYFRTVCPTPWLGLETPAPRFEQFIDEILEQDELSDSEQNARPRFVQRLLGYGITGRSSEHRLPICYGDLGRNGKDTLFEVLGETLGPLAGAASSDVLLARRDSPGNASPHLHDLRGKRLAWVSETNEGARLNAGQVKLVTGGGRLKSRPLYGNLIESQPTHLLFLLTNRKPHAAADDAALWARIIVLAFERRFVDEPEKAGERKADPGLRTTLTAERSGILAWLVRGALEYQRAGLASPQSVKLVTTKYRRDEDFVATFVDHNCRVAGGLKVKAEALYQRYRTWATDAGEKPLTMTAFGRLMGRLYAKKAENTGAYYHGLDLMPLSDAGATTTLQPQGGARVVGLPQSGGFEGFSETLGLVDTPRVIDIGKTLQTHHFEANPPLFTSPDPDDDDAEYFS